jgi:hypothetical protein
MSSRKKKCPKCEVLIEAKSETCRDCKSGFLPFEKARQFIHSLCFKSQTEWSKWVFSSKRLFNIPTNPDKTYLNKGWIDYSDWLNANIISNADKNKNFLPFEEAREFVRSLGMKSRDKDWKIYAKSSKKPSNIPSNPNITYLNKGWISYGDWLGTGNVSSAKFDYKWLSFEEARKFIHSLNLKSYNEWALWHKSSTRPDNIPSNPRKIYRNTGWKGMSDWLRTGNTVPVSQRRSFEEARKFIRSMKFKNGEEYKNYCISGQKPSDILSDPNGYDEYKGMSDWLGTGRVAKRKGKDFLPFEEARGFIHSLGFKTRKNWNKWAFSSERPLNIPSNPNMIYKDKWINMCDWIGIISYEKITKFKPFEEARKFIHTLNLKTLADWKQFCISGQRPSDIPTSPHTAYKNKGWMGYGDWLGTGNISTQLQSIINKEKIIKTIDAIKESIDWLPQQVYWYILIQSGIEPNSKHLNLLKAHQNNKISLKKLIDSTIDNEDYDNDNNSFLKNKKPGAAKILKFLENQILAGMDPEAINAIKAELKSQLWDQIYCNENEEIEKLRGTAA